LPITNQKLWDKCVKNNTDPYGNEVIMVARRAMEILDTEQGEFDCHALICRADDESGAGGITGYQAGVVAKVISSVHNRGEEFRKRFNGEYIKDPAKLKEANDGKGIVNPAILTVG
jgi:hypothetical protein